MLPVRRYFKHYTAHQHLLPLRLLATTTMITVSQIAHALSPSADLYERLSYVQLSLFFNIISRFMPLILTSAPRVTQGLPTLPSDMEHVLSMKLRLTTKDVNTLWCSLGDRLMKDFISDHLSPANLDVDRELSITGPSFHLGELGVQLGMVPLAYSLIVKILSVDTRCRDTRPSHSTMYYSWMSSITQAIRWKSGIFPRYCIYTPTWSSKDTDSHHILPRCEPKDLECCFTILTLHHSSRL